MRWCFLCHSEFSDETRMVIARGGTNICVPCSQTPRGRNEVDPGARRYDGYMPGFGRKGEGLRRSILREQWKEQHGENTPMPPRKA